MNTSSRSAITTMGWDMVYATTFEKVNAGLSASGVLPKSFTGSESDGAQLLGTVSGQWGVWQIVGGSPSNLLWMSCAVSSGELTTPNANTDLAGSSWTMQFGLALVSGSSTPGSGTRYSLAPASSGAGAPKVIASTGVHVTGVDYYVLQAIMEQVLQTQIQALGSSFMSIDIGDTSLSPDQPWLVPTTAAFACEALPSDNQRGGVFALLAMTEGRT